MQLILIFFFENEVSGEKSIGSPEKFKKEYSVALSFAFLRVHFLALSLFVNVSFHVTLSSDPTIEELIE